MIRRMWLAPSLVAAACSSYDAAPSTDDAGTPPPNDAGSTTDAPSDTGTTTDSAPPSFCDVDGGSFCEAFDDPMRTTFDQQQIDPGGAMNTVQDPHVSPPNALRTQVTRPQDAGSCRYVMKTRQGIGIPAPNGFYAEYKVRFALPIADDVSATLVVRITSPTTFTTCDYSLVFSTGTASLGEIQSSGSVYQFHQLSMKPPNGAWSTIAFDVHGAVNSRAVSVWIDGKPALVDDPAMSGCQNVTRIDDLSLGLICVQYGTGSEIDVAFDDVRVIAR